MKKFIVVIILTLYTVSAKGQIVPGEWLTDGIKTNPVTGTVLAHYTDNFPNAEGKTFHVMCASTANGVFFIEQLSSDTTTILRSQAFTVGAFVTFERMRQTVTLDIGETIRIRTLGATGTPGTITGSMQCSMYIDN